MDDKSKTNIGEKTAPINKHLRIKRIETKMYASKNTILVFFFLTEKCFMQRQNLKAD